MVEDAELLRKYCKTKSEEAFATIVRKYVDLVYSVALRQVSFDEHLAKDVAQDVFCDLANKAESLADRASLSGWLYRSARYSALNKVRTERRRREREERAMNDESLAVSNQDAEIDWDKLRPWLDGAISDLAAKDRDAVCLRFFENRSYADIGKKLDLSENAARMRVDRALDKLNGLISGRGIASTGAALATALGTQASCQAPAGLSIALVQSALASTSMTTSGSAIVTIMNSLNTSKIVTGFAICLGAFTGSKAFYKTGEANRIEHELALARESSQALATTIAELEQRLNPENVSVQKVDAAPAANQKNPAAEESDRFEEVTEELVKTRFDEARRLKDQGRYSEALELYLWCFDIGMPRFNRFSGIRAAVIHEINELNEFLPRVVEELRLRRDDAERRLFENDPDSGDFASYTTINRIWGEVDRSLSLYEAPELDEGIKGRLRTSLRNDFIEAQRYEDVYTETMAGTAMIKFDLMMSRSIPRVEGADRGPMEERNRKYAIDQAAMDIETMVGAGDIESAVELAARVLKTDSSADTIEIIGERLDRVNRRDLLDIVVTELTSEQGK